jgi:type II secretory pathway pseudopilin PulG
MEINPYQGTLHGRQTPEPKPSQFRPTLLGCLAVIGIVGVLVALFFPATRSVREPARRVQCAHNLKQIALALHLYADEYGALPPAYTVDAEGKPLHSWRTLILAFLEQEPLYRKIDLSKPWDDPANKEAFDTSLSVYGCPSVDLPTTHTAYMAVVLPGGCFKATEPRKLSEITDDQAWTLMVIEVDAKQAVHWMSPTDSVDLAFLNAKSGAKLPHNGGFQAVFVDGEVRFLSAKLKPETIRALITIDGKDNATAQRED